MTLLKVHGLVLLAVRYPGGANRLIRDGSIRLARRYEPAELTSMIEQLIGRRRPMPGLTCREMLIDVIAHTYDIAEPLGHQPDVPARHAAEAADRVVSYRGRGNARVFARLPLDGLRLTADDYDWTTGDGEPVEGAMIDLLLLLTGRTVAVDRLTGAGADKPRSRRAAQAA